jgi:hypothetical protein
MLPQPERVASVRSCGGRGYMRQTSNAFVKKCVRRQRVALRPGDARRPEPEEKQVRRLKKELARKEKALAEAAALLVLRKKAEAFFLWEEEGDDTTGSSD